jgi:hypothetical protein
MNECPVDLLPDGHALYNMLLLLLYTITSFFYGIILSSCFIPPTAHTLRARTIFILILARELIHITLTYKLILLVCSNLVPESLVRWCPDHRLANLITHESIVEACVYKANDQQSLRFKKYCELNSLR